MTFPKPVIDRATDPVVGIPAVVSYPNLAKMREHLDKWRLEYLVEQERLERSQRKALPEPPRDPAVDRRISEGFKQLAEHLAAGHGPSTI